MYHDLILTRLWDFTKRSCMKVLIVFFFFSKRILCRVSLPVSLQNRRLSSVILHVDLIVPNNILYFCYIFFDYTAHISHSYNIAMILSITVSCE